ncbi:chondroitin AC/alginate lyase [Flagelloscypha sp. PMI_526]|nr:chondroitin AC/alginate lyase [Flagelloscypha sp. PMI_526]
MSRISLSFLTYMSSYLIGCAWASFVSYESVWFDPQTLLSPRPQNVTSSLDAARSTTLRWADETAQLGPWFVTSKTWTPSGATIQDYVSFAPYWWPDCTGISLTTNNPGEVWEKCPYVNRDGQVNPDRSAVNNSGDFRTMSDAVLYNSMAYALTKDEKYATRSASFVRSWFLDTSKGMAPNMNYGQIHRGPGGQKGDKTGILDLRHMCKVVVGLLILRQTQASAWSSTDDASFNKWATQYISWLTTSQLARDAQNSQNNHGSFFVAQLAALQIVVRSTAAAHDTIQHYFESAKGFGGQIANNGDQPFESQRTRPAHYRAFNLMAAVINAQIGNYVGYDQGWTAKSTQGGTILTALSFLLSSPASGNEDEDISPLFMPTIAMIASSSNLPLSGDARNSYAKELRDVSHGTYDQQPWFLYDQPLPNWGSQAMDIDQIFMFSLPLVNVLLYAL